MTARTSGVRALTVALALALAAPAAHAAATFNVINNDPAGVGFNDATPAAPVGGNPGTTVGQQRLNAFQFACQAWGARITSAITINVAATFGPLSCTPSQGVLGAAGPTSGVTFGVSFPNVPANTILTIAEAEKLGNGNFNGTSAEIQAQFNGNIGTATCLTGLSWYYGYDSSPPPGALDFVTVLMHELTHGLGFVTFVDLTTGAEAAGLDDVFELNLRDNTIAPNTWNTMSNAQRLASVTNTNNLVWSGANVVALPVTSGADGSGRKLMYAPNPYQQGSSVSHWTQSSASGSTCPACTDLQPIDLMRPSYQVPTHRAPLAQRALSDIGWGAIATPAIVVTTLADEDDLYMGGSTGLSLREAIKYSVKGDVITFAVNGTINLAAALGPLVIDHDLTIQGPAATTVAVNAGGSIRAIQVTAGTTADISYVDVANGRTFGFGTQGANIRNEGTLHYSYGTLSGGNADSDGGGIWSTGALTVDHALFNNNKSGFDGAGVRIDAGTASFTNCTFTKGTSGFSGAALRNVSGTPALVRHCTITGNAASLNGGGMEGAFTLQNTIVSGNTAGSLGPDVYGAIASLGYNVIGNSADGSGYDPTDRLDANPNLGVLGSNGGHSQTIPIGAGAAINLVPLGSCVSADDQRGTARPQGGACDAGAYEQTNLAGVPFAAGAAGLALAPESNPATGGRLAVRFVLPAGGRARLDVYDVTGRRLVAHDAGALTAGEHHADLTARRTLAPGVYLVRLTQGAAAVTARVTVVD